MKKETVVAFFGEAWQDVKSGIKRCAGALERGWDNFWADVARRKKERMEAKAAKPEAVRIAELKEQMAYLERTRHPLGGTIQFIALLGFLAFLIGLLFLPMEIAGSFEGDLKLDTAGSGISILVPESVKSYDYDLDRNATLHLSIKDINGNGWYMSDTGMPSYLINKTLSININGGQGAIKGTYSIKAPSIIAVAYLLEVDRITETLERLRR